MLVGIVSSAQNMPGWLKGRPATPSAITKHVPKCEASRVRCFGLRPTLTPLRREEPSDASSSSCRVPNWAHISLFPLPHTGTRPVNTVRCSARKSRSYLHFRHKRLAMLQGRNHCRPQLARNKRACFSSDSDGHNRPQRDNAELCGRRTSEIRRCKPDLRLEHQQSSRHHLF